MDSLQIVLNITLTYDGTNTYEAHLQSRDSAEIHQHRQAERAPWKDCQHCARVHHLSEEQSSRETHFFPRLRRQNEGESSHEKQEYVRVNQEYGVEKSPPSNRDFN